MISYCSHLSLLKLSPTVIEMAKENELEAGQPVLFCFIEDNEHHASTKTLCAWKNHSGQTGHRLGDQLRKKLGRKSHSHSMRNHSILTTFLQCTFFLMFPRYPVLRGTYSKPYCHGNCYQKGGTGWLWMYLQLVPFVMTSKLSIF